MVPMSDFSGLASSVCALASAVASAAIEGLDHCMARLSTICQKVKADRPRFGTLSADAMADRLLGVLRHQAFELDLSLLVLEMRGPGPAKNRGKFRPGIG